MSKLLNGLSFVFLIAFMGCEYYGFLGELLFVSDKILYVRNGIFQKCAVANPLDGKYVCKWFDFGSFDTTTDEGKSATILSGITALVSLIVLVLQIVRQCVKKRPLHAVLVVLSVLNAAIIAAVIGLLVKYFNDLNDRYSLSGIKFSLSWSFGTYCAALGLNLIHFILEIIIYRGGGEDTGNYFPK